MDRCGLAGNEEAHHWGKLANVTESSSSSVQGNVLLVHYRTLESIYSMSTCTSMSNNKTFKWFQTTDRVR